MRRPAPLTRLLPLLGAALLLTAAGPRAQSVARLVDASGDGVTPLRRPLAVAARADGTVFVASANSDAVFRLPPGGPPEVVIDASGDGAGAALDQPVSLALAPDGSLLVTGRLSDNVFRVRPGGEVELVIDAEGDGAGHALERPYGLAVGPLGEVYVAGRQSDNVFRVDPGGTVALVLDASGAGPGAELERPYGLAVAPDGALFVAGNQSDNVLRVPPTGPAELVLDTDGALQRGVAFERPFWLATGPAGELFVSALGSDNVVALEPDGTLRELLSPAGDGQANFLDDPYGLAADAAGSVFVTSETGCVFKVSPHGSVRCFLAPIGTAASLSLPSSVALDGNGGVLVAGTGSDEVFRVTTSAATWLRNGSELNPRGYTESTQAVIGADWRTHVRLDGTGASVSSMGISIEGPLAGLPLAIGELLCVPPFLRASTSVVAGSDHVVPIPPDPRLVGVHFWAQASSVRLGPVRVQLQNALDVRIGSF